MTETVNLPSSWAKAKRRGAKRFFTGKPCKHGHVSDRLTSNRACIECGKKSQIAWVANNIERRLKYFKDYNSSQRPPNYWKIYYREHLEQRRATNRRAYNPSKAKVDMARWRAANPERIKLLNASGKACRRAREKEADGFATADEIAAIRKAQKDKCAYCSKRLRGGGHLDHIKPIAAEGSNWPRNLQWLCGSCNQRKWAKDPLVFAQEIGRLL